MSGPHETSRITSAARLHPRRRGAILMLAALTLAITSVAQGQPDFRRRQQDSLLSIDQVEPPFSLEQLRSVTIEPQVLEIVCRLDSAEFKERESASEALRQNDAWRIQMYALLAGETLTVEQRCRLLQVVRTQLVNTPRGALGIEMAPLLPMGGEALEIRVVDLIPGLPAERLLQVGDRITAIDNQPLFMQDDLQSRVQAKRPGEIVNVTVKRAKVDDNGRTIKDANGDPVTELLKLDIALGPAEILEKQNRNLATVSNRVRNARRIEADAVTFAFAPKAQDIAVQGGLRSLTHDDPIDQHPVILNLLVQIEMLGDYNGEQTKMMQEMWRRQLADLKQLANHPGLSEDERARMQRVAARFWELMNSVQ